MVLIKGFSTLRARQLAAERGEQVLHKGISDKARRRLVYGMGASFMANPLLGRVVLVGMCFDLSQNLLSWRRGEWHVCKINVEM